MTTCCHSAVIVFLLSHACTLRAQSTPYEPPGRLFDVGDYRVHLHCTGEGNPTVMVVGSGFSFDWELVQSGAEKFARICVYDPSGTIWSDPGPGASCRQRADEIHNLFRAAGLDAPYVLVGLSTGAIVARLYAAQHPAEIAGRVIVDHAFLPDSSPPAGKNANTSPGPDSPPILLYATPIVLTVEDDPAFSNLPERIQRMHRWADSLNPALPTVQTAEECMRDTAVAEKGAQPLARIPLVVVSTANDAPGYAQLQRDLMALSEDSQQLIAQKSFHSIELSEPGVVTNAIRLVIEAVRGDVILRN